MGQAGSQCLERCCAGRAFPPAVAAYGRQTPSGPIRTHTPLDDADGEGDGDGDADDPGDDGCGDGDGLAGVDEVGEADGDGE
jgi:hypothetical protein